MRCIIYTVIILIAISLAGSLKLAAQDKLVLLGGNVIDCEVVSIENYMVTYHDKSKKGKVVELKMPTYRLFAVEYGSGNEDVIYEQDTTIGRFESADEMRMFVYGEQDAFKNHRERLSLIGGAMLSGAAGYAFADGFLVIVTPIVFVIVNGIIIGVSMKKFKPRNEKLMRESLYLAGYKKIAKSKKVRASLVGSIAGTALGMAAWYLIVKPNSTLSGPLGP